jgi:parallel beta-helix repeat protein
VIRITANSVNVLNFTVRNAGRTWVEQPWYIESCIQGSNLADVTVENVTCVSGAVSVWFDRSSYIDISDNSVSNGEYLGIGGYTLQNVSISNNVVFSIGSDGIHLDGGSRYCRVVNNTVSGAFDGITLETNEYSPWPTSDNLIDGNSIANITIANIGMFNCGTNVFRRNNMTGRQNNLVIWGHGPDAFLQDIDASNTANGKILYCLTNQTDFLIDPLNCPNAGDIIVVDCVNTTIRDFDLTSCMDGIVLAGSSNCTLMNVTIGNNREPVAYQGVPFIYGGITLFESNNNTVVDSTIYNNTYGVCLYHSDWDLFYDNMFINIDRCVVSDYTSIFRNASSGYVSKSEWDNGLEGNYWSSYNGTDANQDGIGDTPYVMDSNNSDHYTLMGRFHGFTVTWQEKTYPGYVISNSTISGIGYAILTSFQLPNHTVINTSFESIYFYVSGEDGTHGFCRVYIPVALLNTTYRVFVNGTEVPYALLPCSNSTDSYLYFTYSHSTEWVEITPEFASPLILPLSMMATVLAIITYRRKGKKNKAE